MTMARHICKNPSAAYSLTQMKNVICTSERVTLHWHRTAQLSLHWLTVLFDAGNALDLLNRPDAQVLRTLCIQDKYEQKDIILKIQPFVTFPAHRTRLTKKGKIHNYSERIGKIYFVLLWRWKREPVWESVSSLSEHAITIYFLSHTLELTEKQVTPNNKLQAMLQLLRKHMKLGCSSHTVKSIHIHIFGIANTWHTLKL